MFINSILFNSLFNVYLLLLVFTHIHVWMLMCTNACAYACGGWRSTSDVVSQCCLLYVSRQGFPLAWNSPVGLSCLHLFSTSLNVHNTMLGLYGFEGSNLVHMFAREPLTNYAISLDLLKHTHTNTHECMHVRTHMCMQEYTINTVLHVLIFN